jgi:perosamine synthetase
MIGFKYKLSNPQAAIGCAQLERIDELVARKRVIFERYRTLLSDLPLVMNPEPPGTLNGYWMPTIVFGDDSSFDRTALLNRLRDAEIDGRVFFWPLSSLPVFETPIVDAPVAKSISARALNLPSYHDMTDSEIERVADVVRDFVLKGGR